MSGRADVPDPMRVQSTEVDAVRIDAPASPCHHIVGTNGEMWQWYGDGTGLITSIVAVRRQCTPSATAVHHLLNAEVDRISCEFDRYQNESGPNVSIAYVPGSRAAFQTTLSGPRSGIQMHDNVLMASDGSSLYLSRIVVTDTSDGRDLAATMNSTVKIVPRRS